MQTVGFQFTKIHAERDPDYKKSSLQQDINFTNIEKTEIPIAKESEGLIVSFIYSLLYTDPDKSEKGEKSEKKTPHKNAEITFEGKIILTASKDEVKNITKDWKKKIVPNTLKIPLFNLILKKCSIKAAQIEEDLSLPIHLPLPKIAPKEEKQEQ